jgi:fructuronate reductase
MMPGVEDDFAAGPVLPKSYIGKVVTLLHARYTNNELPIAMVSMDNCSHNGDKLYAAVKEFAEEWENRGVCKPGFLAYVNNPSKVSFPWTMIDKITPRPDAKIEKILADDGIEQLEPVITSKKTYVAPFVNAEECQYLVIEDAFPNGRPELEKAGLYFTDRATVDKVEKMKVCTCLNPLHTFLAVSGCLLGYTLIADEMKDPDLLRLVKRLGYEEGLPVVVDPGIIKPRDFIDEVVNIRIPNPFMPDTPQRIACDTSQKLSIRFGETIKGYLARPDLDVASLKVVPLVFALWLRYLKAIDDNGNTFELSPDPLLDECKALTIDDILHRTDIFGVDLFEAGLAPKVKEYFNQLTAGNGAVRKILQSL